MPIDEQQLSAMIDAAVREAVERTTQQLTAKFEDETAGLRRSRDAILAEKKAVEGKNPAGNFDEWLAGVDERLRKAREQSDRWSGKGNVAPIAPPTGDITITREAARDGAAYRAAKAESQAKGVQLLVVDEGRRAPGPAAMSRVRYVEDAASRTLYANKEVVREAGGLQRLKANAEREGKRVIVFRSVDDLPSHLHRAHAETLAAQKPDTLLEGGE